MAADGKKKTDKAKAASDLGAAHLFRASLYPRINPNPSFSPTMASREGINPLRPYYIPQTGISPSTNTTPEPSPSSTHVFGSTARDFIPDLDYGDYLDASPSVSDWVRDAINGALVRYSQILTAQPFDVAKTILQVYVVPDATDEHDRRPSPDARGSSHESVWTWITKLPGCSS